MSSKLNLSTGCFLSFENEQYPCQYESLTDCYTIITNKLESSLNDRTLHSLSLELERFFKIVMALRSTPHLQLCKKHSSLKLTWSDRLLNVLISYIVENSTLDSSRREVFLLYRLLEIVLSPPAVLSFSDLEAPLIGILEKLRKDRPETWEFFVKITFCLPSKTLVNISKIYIPCADIVLSNSINSSTSIGILHFLICLSSHTQVQQELIDQKLFKKLYSWLDKFYSNLSSVNTNHNIPKLMVQLLVNILPSLDSKKDFKDHIYEIICNYENPSFVKQAICPILYALPFSGFKTICLHFNRSKPISQSRKSDANNLEVFNSDEIQSIYNFIYKMTYLAEPSSISEIPPGFDIEWKEFDEILESDFYSAECLLITFILQIDERIIKIILYVDLESGNGVISTKAKMKFNKNLLLYSISKPYLIRSQLDVVVEYHSKEKNESQMKIKVLNEEEEIISYEYNKNARFNISAIKKLDNSPNDSIWGSAQYFESDFQPHILKGFHYINLTKIQNNYSIYSYSYLDSIQIFRGDNPTFLVPDFYTIKNFLELLFDPNESLVDFLKVFYGGHKVEIDEKICSLLYQDDEEYSFQILDLYLEFNNTISNVQQNLKEFAQKLITSYVKPETPLLASLLGCGDPLNFFQGLINSGNITNQLMDRLQKRFLMLNDIQFSDFLPRLLRNNLFTLLWFWLFDDYGLSKKSKKIFYTSILKEISQLNHSEFDIYQFNDFLETCIRILFEEKEENFVNHKLFELYEAVSNINSDYKQVKLLCESIIWRKTPHGVLNDCQYDTNKQTPVKNEIEKTDGESEVFTNLKEEQKLKDPSFQDNAYFETDGKVPHKDQEDKKEINETNKEGIKSEENLAEMLSMVNSFLENRCSDTEFFENYNILLEAATHFQKTAGYVTNLYQETDFMRDFEELISQIDCQADSEENIQKINPNIFDIVSSLISSIYEVFAKEVQKNSSLLYNRENIVTNLTPVSYIYQEFQSTSEKRRVHSRNLLKRIIFTLQELARQDLISSADHNKVINFYKQCVHEINDLGIAQILVKILAKSLENDSTTDVLEIQKCILELLEEWANHSFFIKVFDWRETGDENWVLTRQQFLQILSKIEGRTKGLQEKQGLKPDTSRENIKLSILNKSKSLKEILEKIINSKSKK